MAKKTMDSEDPLVKELRKIMRRERERKMSQRNFAEKMRLSSATMSDLETGKIRLTMARVLEYCKNALISPAYLFDLWMNSPQMNVIDENRKRHYIEVIESCMIMGFGAHLDYSMELLRGLVDNEKKNRKNQEIKEERQEIFNRFYRKDKRSSG